MIHGFHYSIVGFLILKAGGGRTRKKLFPCLEGSNISSLKAMKRKQDIIENVTVVFKHGGKQLFDVIKIVKNGIYIGQFNTGKRSNKKFEEHSFIPHDQIKKIIICTNNGKQMDIEI